MTQEFTLKTDYKLPTLWIGRHGLSIQTSEAQAQIIVAWLNSVLREEIECAIEEDIPAGPFVAQDSTFVHSTHLLFGDGGEAFTVTVKRDEAERLVEWLNELWAEREAGG